MATNAYPQMYLYRAQAVLGEAFDYAINVYEIDPALFFSIFSISRISECMGKGDPEYITGVSGIELFALIMEEAYGKDVDINSVERFFRSPQYWMGWAIAYYQWYSNRTYREIMLALSYPALLSMYSTLHEADITKFVSECDRLIKAYYPETNLKRIRKMRGMTQAQLSSSSGVSLRSVQLYEQRVKDINKASIEAVYRLSRVLHTSMESLMEK